MRLLVALSFLCLPLGGCYHTTYSTGASRADHLPPISGTNHFFLYGLANGGNVNAASLCSSSRLAKLDVYESFLDGFLAVLTAGIYTPRSYELWCASAAPPPTGHGDVEVVP